MRRDIFDQVVKHIGGLVEQIIEFECCSNRVIMGMAQTEATVKAVKTKFLKESNIYNSSILPKTGGTHDGDRMTWIGCSPVHLDIHKMRGCNFFHAAQLCQ